MLNSQGCRACPVASLHRTFSVTKTSTHAMETLTQSPRRTAPLRSLQNEVNRLFETVFPNTTGENDETTATVWTPRMDLMETDDHYRMHVDLPGITKGDVSITVDDNRLTIRGERTVESRTDAENVVRMERKFGAFYRSLRLPRAVNESKIKATFADGVLSVEIPKAEKSKPKKIKIS